MGAISQHRSKGTSHLDFFNLKADFKWENPTHSWQLVDTASVGNVVYGAYERVDKATGTREVSAIVFVTQWLRKEACNFYWKACGEAGGPCHWDCPARILKMLTPLPELAASGIYSENALKYATEWRQLCQRNIELSKSLKKGAVVEVEPVDLGTWGVVSRLLVESVVPWQVQAIAHPYNFRVKISRKTLLERMRRFEAKKAKEAAA